MLIRGEPLNGTVLSATMAGSLVGNYAGQKGAQNLSIKSTGSHSDIQKRNDLREKAEASQK